ncbi:MAG: PQQ-binding-like beta-propeller repeat protein, partial [Planctomycetes bacterium]|nr:PQQ-binding-like beta-propeller repeat protein [Planctomycetota bacterium]
HGPTPQAIDGRVFIEGRDMIRAVDAYTGRLLWEREYKDIGLAYDNTAHQPGANEVGSNYASASDGIYVAYGRGCDRLDPETGASLAWIELPRDGRLRGARWGFTAIYKDLLLATAVPIDVELVRRKDGKPTAPENDDADDDDPEDIAAAWNARSGVASKWLLVIDRYSGQSGLPDSKTRILWKREAAAAFRHNAIVAGAGRVFAIDGLSETRLQALKFRGQKPATAARLYAFDARTGKVLWETAKNITGTWLGYSEARDILLVAGSRARDRSLDEPGEGLAAYRGRDGKLLWTSDEEYKGPCLIHGDTILTQAEAFDLVTGKPRIRRHPLTGEAMPWIYSRNYGCNTSIASRNLILFRSAAAGYYDLTHDGGTGNLGGFKSGCTSNLIAASGILSAPDYTRTCTCSYQNQCSVAFVHDPDVEVWTFDPLSAKAKTIRRAGLNFGAPGDRMADDGTLWIDWPSVGGASPKVSVKAKPDRPKTFRMHMSAIEAGEKRWVAASGLLGVESIALTLVDSKDAPRRYTVRLVFAEPSEAEAGDRVFSVSLQGEEVLTDFDVVAEAGGARRAVVREFKGVEVSGDLKLEFRATAGKTLLCGLEVVAE